MAWTVTTDHLERLAIGAGILGTGGGGNPYMGKIVVSRLVRAGANIQVVSLDEVPDDATVVTVGGMGSPTIGVERPGSGEESYRALRALEKHIGRKVTHIVSSEIGGGNSTTPLRVATQAGIPVIDGDGMGRAFPELQMKTYIINGIPPTPGALCDYNGHTVVFDHVEDGKTFERYMRAVTIQMGGGAGYSFPLMTGEQVRRTAVPGTLSLAIRLGDAVLNARANHTSPVEAALGVTGGFQLFRGKITDVERRLVGGFARGLLKMEGTGDDLGRTLDIDFQNENLIARRDNGEVIAVVPDLICLVDADTGAPLTTEVVRYGMRAAVLGIPAPVELKTDAALRSVGPAAFGYPEVEYVPLPGYYANVERVAAVSL
ncbi:MAG TPA: DUF917 domain-containing protein [Thermomicrobiales bacterium]|nr:DUF917 domain-containing protein [Thermomicrobiales bacterium]